MNVIFSDQINDIMQTTHPPYDLLIAVSIVRHW